MLWTRPDIAFSVSTLGQFLSKFSQMHWEAALDVMKYAKSTSGFELMFNPSGNWDVMGLCDSDWAGDLKSGKSHFGYIFYVGQNVVSWKSKKSHSVATSSTMAELEGLYNAIIEGIWLSEFVHNLGFIDKPYFVVKSDNQAVIAIVNGEKGLERTKHEVVKVEFIRDKIRTGICKVEYVKTTENTADIFTKSLPAVTFIKHREGAKLAKRAEAVQESKG
jgi:hypothetical protein